MRNTCAKFVISAAPVISRCSDTECFSSAGEYGRGRLAPFRVCRSGVRIFRVWSAYASVMIAWTAAFFAALAAGLAMAAADVDDRKPSTVFVAVLVRNKAHTLPYFLSALESQDYPKDRMHLW